MMPVACSNCGKVIGEAILDSQLSSIQVYSCGDKICNGVAEVKAKEIFDRHFQDKSFGDRMNMLVVGEI